MNDHNELIRKTYYDPESGFVGAEALYKQLKKSGVTRKEIKSFLEKQETEQIHKKETSGYSSFLPTHPKQEFQIDLIYLQNPYLNNNNKYVLTAVDAFTKQAWGVPLKKRTGQETADAFKEVIQKMGVPETIYSDQGSEFKNKWFQKLLDDNNIEAIWTVNHASVVERFNRTLKERVHKYLDSHQSVKTWINILPNIINGYNKQYHSTIGIKPKDYKEEYEDFVLFQIASHGKFKPMKRLKVGDSVRLKLHQKGLTTKGYKAQYSSKIYKISKIDGSKYFVEGNDNYFLRSELKGVSEEVETNPNEPELKGTKEGFLKDLAKRQVVPAEAPPSPSIKSRKRRTNYIPASELLNANNIFV